MSQNPAPFQPVRTIYSVERLIVDFEAVLEVNQQNLASAKASQSALLVPANQALLDRTRETLTFLFKLRADNVQEIATPHPLSDGRGVISNAHPDYNLICQIRAGQVQPA